MQGTFGNMSTTSATPPGCLDFRDLDDLALGVHHGSEEAKHLLQVGRCLTPGVLLEALSFWRRIPHTASSDLLSEYPLALSLIHASNLKTQEAVSKQATSGFLRLAALNETTHPLMAHALGIAAKRAMLRAGIPNQTGSALIGAMGELIDNVFSHSLDTNSGIAGFAVLENWFEFCVADSGQGALAGYRRNPEFSNLEDDAAALLLAVRDHVSRHGRRSGGGTGFRTLLRALGSTDAVVRVRSGDQALNVSGSASRRFFNLEQKVPLQGFVVTTRIPIRTLRRIA